jgi:UDP-N-acetylmuramate: L-alanyl-gamma-D-glutamyl-meso-diaminopimelate ligase
MLTHRLPTDRAPRVHFCGIGGTGMVAAARLALEAGWEVRGSDNPLYPPTSHMVEALGIPVATAYAASNLDWAPDVVVIGNALSRGNPEVEAALERRLAYVSFPEWIKGAVLRERRPVAICGTHGKTTTTALAAHVLTECGLDPGYLIGGQPKNLAHPARLGPVGAPFVVEGDEYDSAFFDKRAKFFHYLPEIAVVTSLEFDHGDIYPALADIERAFQLMLRQVPGSGRVVLCADEAGAMALTPHALAPVVTYGLGEGAAWRGRLTPEGDRARLAVEVDGQPWGEALLPSCLAGQHNARNVLAAIAVAGLLGAAPDRVMQAIASFQGVKRRMEVFLEARGACFVDDFAHHPTAIFETVRAARLRWPDQRLIVLFEPRSNTTVTNRFQARFPDAFAPADVVWLGPIYRGERLGDDERLDRTLIVEALRLRGKEAYSGDDVGELVAWLESELQAQDVVLILSNGAFGGIYERLQAVFGATA